MTRSTLFAYLAWLTCLALAMTGSAGAAPFAYITHGVGVSRYVAVIDTSTNAVVAQVATPGSGGFGVAVDAAGTRTYVASNGTNAFWVIDTARNVLLATAAAGEGPIGIAVNPAGTQAFLTNKNSLLIFDTSTNKLTRSFSVGNDPFGIVVNATGTRVYVAASGSNEIAVFDPTIPAVIARIATGAGSAPLGLALDGARNRLYVANRDNGTVGVIDTATHMVVKSIAAGVAINGVAVNAAGTRAYAADGTGVVAVIDTVTSAVIAKIQVGGFLVSIDVHPAGTYCYVVDTANDRVVVIDTATNLVVKSIPVGRGPIAFGQFIGPAQAQAVEYFHASFGHYFVTASAGEIGKLDNGFFAGWARTGEAFNVFPAGTGSVPDVCRFFTEKFPPSSSHFYTPFATECATVMNNPDWSFEGLVFGVDVPDATGACRAGTMPVYRFYNNGLGGAPNHRYTTSPAIRAAMFSQGWTPEGVGADSVIACVPS